MMNEKLRAAAQEAYRAMISAELSDGSRREWEAAVDGLKDALAEPAIKESLTVQRPWVGLTDEEIYVEAEKEEQAHGFILGAMWAETKLREKNT